MTMNEEYNNQALPPGTMIQGYRLERVLGSGSFGIVYLANKEHLDKPVAIKELLPDQLTMRTDGTRVVPLSSDKEEMFSWAVKKFLDEAKILWDLSHINIVRVTDYHKENGTAYMVMDYEKGEPLSAILKRCGTLPEADLKRILVPLFDGLEAIHEKSVWHRDIKPDNILIRPDGSPVLIDFGAAHQEVKGAARSMMSTYTPSYAAPEQVTDMGKQGPWTDIYALGATLYRAMTGDVPTSALIRVRREQNKPAIDIAYKEYSPAFIQAINAALQPFPMDRPQSVAEWREIMQITPQDSVSSPTVVIHHNKQQQMNIPNISGRGRNILIWTTVVFVLILGLTMLGWQMFWESPEEQVATVEPPATERKGQIGEVQPSLDTIPKTQEKVLAEVNKILNGIECAHLTATLLQDQQLSIAGHVSNSNNREHLLEELSRVEGIAIIADKIQIEPWPFCEILKILGDHEAKQTSHVDGIKIETNKPDRIYKEGEFLVVNATATQVFDGYLYVDYIDNDGNVFHMLPSPLIQDNAVMAGQHVVLGIDKDSTGKQTQVYEVFPPHGRNMILAIASRHRLFPQERPEQESAKQYLPALAGSLKLRPDALSSYIYITTHE